MKKNYYISALILISGFLAGCANDINETGQITPETGCQSV